MWELCLTGNQEAFQNLTLVEMSKVIEQLPVDILATSLILGEFGVEVLAVKATDKPWPCSTSFGFYPQSHILKLT